MAVARIQSTKNYRLFHRSDENRPTDLRKHKKLERSMKKYGFLKSFPIVVFRDANGRLIVKDGQHRLAIAETLDLPVHWVEESVDFDVAEVNQTPKGWTVLDFAQKHMANGKAVYQEVIEFHKQHGLPLGIAAAMLGGTTSYSNVQQAFQDGTFRVRDRAWADAVAGIYSPTCRLAPSVKNVRFLEACMAVCRVSEFDAKRFLLGVNRCPERLLSFSTKEAYLDMMEGVYNFGRSRLFGLKVAATMVMRERSMVGKVGRKKRQDAAAAVA